MQVRPLGRISDFVVEYFPKVLASEPAKLMRIVTDLISRSLADAIEEAYRSKYRSLAALDLKMLELGIVHNDFVSPQELVDLVNKFSDGDVKGLTYEEIILANPNQDLRRFTMGDVAQTEQLFYCEHQALEAHLLCAITQVRSAIEQLALTSLDRTIRVGRSVQLLGGISNHLNPIIASTRILKDMPRAHFAVFRKYLGSHPIRGFRGPSGLFSGKFHTLELLLRGEELPLEDNSFVHKHLDYFPRRDLFMLEEALKWADKSFTLTALAKKHSEPDSLMSCLGIIGLFFNKFRAVHRGAVTRQLSYGAEGTAGETPEEFLDGRMKTHRWQ